MNPKQAVDAHRDLGAEQSLGMHYETFRLSFESFEDPEQELSAARTSLGLNKQEFDVIEVGESVRY